MTENDSKASKSVNIPRRFVPVRNGTAFSGMKQLGDASTWDDELEPYVRWSDYELLRAALENVRVMAHAINGHRTHWEACEHEHPWCKVEIMAAQALTHETIPKHRFTAEAKEGYCIHCSRVMGQHSKGDLYCPETTFLKFANVSCSQCGRDFGPGNHGYSHCSNHSDVTPVTGAKP